MGRDVIEAWTATLADGSRLSSADVPTFEEVTRRGGCRALGFTVGGRSFSVACVPELGDSIRLFTRRAIKWTSENGHNEERRLDMPVAEIARVDGSRSRLYVHPEHGPIFSTLDLNL